MLFDLYYRKGGSQIGILGFGKADQGYGLPIGVQFLGHLVQKLTSYEHTTQTYTRTSSSAR
jgi:hypothetical protein